MSGAREEHELTVNWTIYRVELQVIDRLVGGIPIIPEGADSAHAYEQWARGQNVEEDPSFEQTLPEALAEEPDMPVSADKVEGLQTGFRSSEDGMYIEARQIKAMLREAAQRLGIIKTKRGSRQVLQHDLVVKALDGSQKIPLGVKEPSGTDSRPISVVTRQGPRTSIKTFSFVERSQLVFELRVLSGGVGDNLIGESELHDMLEFGGELGLGADRSQGEGKFELVTLRTISE